MGILNTISGIATNFLNNFPLFSFISGLGSYGPIVFRVSENGVLTPTDVSIDTKSRVKQHNRLSAVDITEYETRELKSVSLSIKLIYDLCDIDSTIQTLTRICENGEHYPLILARKKIGNHNFRLDSMSYKYGKTDKNGTPLVIEVSLNLQEYIETINRIGDEEITGIVGIITAKTPDIISNNLGIISTLAGGRLW
jgi:phage protein U